MPRTHHTRSRILETARTILLEDGLRALTTHEVASRARISKKTLYAVFASKDDLIEAVVVSFVEQNLIELDRILELPDSAIVRIKAALGFISEFMPQLQVHVIDKIQRFDPHLWAKIDRIRIARLKRLAALIPLAQADGHVRKDLDPDLWLLLFLGAIRSVLTPKTLIDEGLRLMQVVDTIEHLFVEGILTASGHAAIHGTSITGKDSA